MSALLGQHVDHQPKWRVIPAFELHWRCGAAWGEGAVVFHGGSGDTHLLNPIAAEALHALAEAPADCRELARRLAAALELESVEDLVGRLKPLLAEFNQLGLIEPAP